MSDAAGSEIWSFDPLGRVVTSKRKTNKKTKLFNYAYHLDGSLKFILYPSGRQVDYAYNAAGRALSAVDAANGVNYATQALYAPQGALSSLKTGVTGSFAGYSRTWSCNDRLQPKDIVATAPAPTGDIFSLNYQFDLGLANNGNVMQITNNLNSARTQSFSYDELNRIQTAGVPSDWGLSYAYDRYGNLLSRSVTQGSAPALSVAVNSSNQITNAGFSYDAAGNMTADGSGSFAYDAENRMTSTAGVDYTYDGDGRRVKKSNGTLYWYGVGGEVLMETNSGGNNPKEFVFFNGTRVARRDPSGSVFYYFEDHLGSSRIIVQDGQNLPCYEADFYPFGGERVILDTCPQPYKFTGKERDSESGLDYYGARYYASNLGRLTGVDPVKVTPGRLRDPQQLNLYSYVRNNPLRFIDPDGEILRAFGDLDTAKAKLCENLGGECDQISIDQETGIVTIDFSGIDLNANEGALLLSQLINSDAVFGLTLGESMETAASELTLLSPNNPSNLDNFDDPRFGKGKPPSRRPPEGIDVQVGFNPSQRFRDTKNRVILTSSIIFHELVEAYSKVHGAEGRPGLSRFTGAHADAVVSEFTLRNQRPYLKNTGRAGDNVFLIRDPK